LLLLAAALLLVIVLVTTFYRGNFALKEKLTKKEEKFER